MFNDSSTQLLFGVSKIRIGCRVYPIGHLSMEPNLFLLHWKLTHNLIDKRKTSLLDRKPITLFVLPLSLLLIWLLLRTFIGVSTILGLIAKAQIYSAGAFTATKMKSLSVLVANTYPKVKFNLFRYLMKKPHV